MLLMKKAFFEAVRAGRKTTTVRYWRHRRVRAGQVHTAPGLGKLRIEEVRAVRLSELTAADAAADGFASLAQMRKALKSLYPALPSRGARGRSGRGEMTDEDGRTLYAVHFTYLENACR